MADKGLNVFDEMWTEYANSQTAPTEIRENGAIAKVRTSVEQLIL